MSVKKTVEKKDVVSKETKEGIIKTFIQQMINAIYASTIQHKVLKNVEDKPGMLEIEKVLVKQERMKLAYEKALMEVEKE